MGAASDAARQVTESAQHETQVLDRYSLWITWRHSVKALGVSPTGAPHGRRDAPDVDGWNDLQDGGRTYDLTPTALPA